MKITYLALAAMAALPHAAHADWQEASSKHFVVYSDDSPEKVKAFTTRLERYDKAMRVLRGVRDDNRGPSSRVTVYVVSSLSEVQKLAGQSNVGGFYVPRTSGPVSFVPRKSGGSSVYQMDAERILLHEYGHHFMFNDWPSAVFPKWFVEGFAEFHSTAIFREDGSIVFGAPPVDRGWGVTMVNQMPLEHMLQPDPGKLDRMQSFALYSRGWLLTHYLTFDAERRKQLGTYITAINEGKPAEEATKVFGNLNSLDSKLTAYVKRSTFQTLAIPPEQLKVGEVTVRQLGPGEAAVMPARIRSKAGVDEKSAPKVAALARQLAAPFPSDSSAQNVLTEAEYDAKNYDAAIAAADRALAADPKSVHAAVYRGMALQAVAEKDKAPDPAKWREIRKWYAAANKMDPENPEPLLLYYRSFRDGGQTPTASAESGLLYAYALAPYDLSVRMDAARVFLAKAKIVQAREALLPVAYSDDNSYAKRVRTVVEALDKGGAPAAIAALDRADEDARKEADKAKEG